MERQGNHKSLTSQSETNTKSIIFDQNELPAFRDTSNVIREDGAQEHNLSATRERSTPTSMVCCAPSSQSETNTTRAAHLGLTKRKWCRDYWQVIR
ncbi:hypothetical protein BOTCAL_0527g00100 [Botryotinia calthae]|uniref:Uncharacterized protein n=1 Tax=Botryotinia calthae TaxID=38488 RepID=A0A4Y8CKM3_9HELO|nr:hypothetical protein BOTCAL_0527g00100 [Botryotinia calthae]